MTEEQITFIDALIDTNASIASIARVFPNMTVDEFITNSTRYTSVYRRWTAEQEHFVLKHVKLCTPLADLAEAFTKKFGFSRSEGALKSRIRQIIEQLEEK